MKELNFKVQKFNPVDHMTTDEEIIEYMIDCLDFDDDPDGIVFQRACEFVGASRGMKVFGLISRVIRELKGQDKQTVAARLAY